MVVYIWTDFIACRLLYVDELLSFFMCWWTSVVLYVWADFCRLLYVGELLSFIMCGQLLWHIISWWTSVDHFMWADFCRSLYVGGLLSQRTRVVLIMWADLWRILVLCGLVSQRTSDIRTNGERTIVERTIDVVPVLWYLEPYDSSIMFPIINYFLRMV